MPNAESRLRMYPRGFLGGDVRPQVERTADPYSGQVKKHQFIANDRGAAASYIAANPFIEGLYSDYVRNNINTEIFEFRKKVLEAAMGAFGTDSFLVWYLSQFSSPAASDLHNRFLSDTIKYISCGARDMSLETWQSLLIITDEGNNIGSIPEKTKEFFGVYNNGDLSRADSNTSLVDVIQKWCSKENGLEDLLGTLHILFGNV